MTFTIANILIFLVSFTNIFLGILLLTHGERRRKDLFLALFVFCISLWGISIAMMTVIPDIIWPRLAFWFISASFVFFNFFLQNYFKEKGLVISKVIYGLSALGIFFWAVSLGNSIMSDIGILEDSVYFVGVSLGFGKWYNSLLLYYLTNFLYDVYLMFSAYRKVDIKTKSQIRLFFIGISFFAALGLVTNLILPRLGIFSFNNLGPVFSLVMTSFMVYAVLRWQLFSIKIITTEIAVFLLWISFLFFTFSSISDQFWSKVIVPIAAIPLGLYIINSTIKDVKRETREKEKEIQHRKEVEKLAKELGTANERLKELDALKTEFISFATHQLRAPIAAIKGYASEILQGDFGQVSGNLKAPTEVIMESSSSLAVLVDDYLNVSRIEQGKMKYEFSDFNLADLVNEVANEQRPSIEKKGLKLEVDGGPPGGEASALIHADRGKIKQVIINLLDNATKYTPARATPKASAGQAGIIAISLTEQDGKARLSVKDTGAGIKSETMSHLFQKFSRASDASKYNLFGTGLGLYLASELLKAHNGRVWAESPGEGKGATFFVELPIS